MASVRYGVGANVDHMRLSDLQGLPVVAANEYFILFYRPDLSVTFSGTLLYNDDNFTGSALLSLSWSLNERDPNVYAGPVFDVSSLNIPSTIFTPWMRGEGDTNEALSFIFAGDDNFSAILPDQHLGSLVRG